MRSVGGGSTSDDEGGPNIGLILGAVFGSLGVSALCFCVKWFAANSEEGGHGSGSDKNAQPSGGMVGVAPDLADKGAAYRDAGCMEAASAPAADTACSMPCADSSPAPCAGPAAV